MDKANNKYNIIESTKEDNEVILKGLVEYNLSQVPSKQKENFMPINRSIKDENGEVIAGIISVMYGWNCLYVDILWVSENHRKDGLGSKLLKEVERVAKENGCKLIHLDTFDFQAKDFYLKHGFEIFGVLDDCPEEHKRYYLKKKL